MTNKSLDHKTLRNVAGAFPTGIAVVSSCLETGDVIGMTINSFVSVSLDPPLILFSAARDCNLLEVCAEGVELSFNILSESQKDISDQFAGIDSDANARLFNSGDRLMQLEGVSAWYQARIDAMHDAGDHVLIVCEVVDCLRDESRRPIVFHSGYRKIGDSLG